MCCPMSLLSRSIPENDALKVANKWLKREYNKSTEILDTYTETYNNSTSLYIFNFTDGGFVLVSADNKINPILGYSEKGFLKPDSNNVAITALLNNYKIKIDFIKKNKSEKNNKNTLQKWKDLQTGGLLKATLKSTVLNVPSLFETEQTSRWAAWGGYNVMMPNQDASNSCVNLAMAQICKYHKHPKQGTGTNSYTQYYDGATYNWSIDYSQHIYNYDFMPFRLTYCENGEGHPLCSDGNWMGFLPGITEENKEEISKLIFHIGLGISKEWFGLPSYTWLDDWALVFEENLNFKSTWSYWSESEILDNPENFKSSMRNNLINKLPIFYRVAGHAIVIDGFENEDYFHCAFGRGGYTDGYYYLFNSDADGVHLIIPGSSDSDAILDLEPDYSFPENLSITSTISLNTTKCYQAINSVSISSIIDGNGSSGANISIYSKEITLGNGFEIKKGATLYINIEDYSL